MFTRGLLRETQRIMLMILVVRGSVLHYSFRCPVFTHLLSNVCQGKRSVTQKYINTRNNKNVRKMVRYIISTNEFGHKMSTFDILRFRCNISLNRWHGCQGCRVSWTLSSVIGRAPSLNLPPAQRRCNTSKEIYTCGKRAADNVASSRDEEFADPNITQWTQWRIVSFQTKWTKVAFKRPLTSMNQTIETCMESTNLNFCP